VRQAKSRALAAAVCRPEIRHLRVSPPCLRPRGLIGQAERPAFQRPRVRAGRRHGTDRRPRFHAPRDLSGQIGASPHLARGMARRDLGPRVVAADDAEDLQFTGAGRRQPQVRLVARPASRSYEGTRRRQQRVEARPAPRQRRDQVGRARGGGPLPRSSQPCRPRKEGSCCDAPRCPWPKQSRALAMDQTLRRLTALVHAYCSRPGAVAASVGTRTRPDPRRRRCQVRQHAGLRIPGCM
jgi:hypothetical protein